MIIGKIGPAFPAEEWINSNDPSAVNPIRHQGMSLRDYFAAKAMQSLILDSDFREMLKQRPSDFVEATNELADEAYGIADAMLIAREFT